MCAMPTKIVFWKLAEHLPSEGSGGAARNWPSVETPPTARPVAAVDPFEHPDAQTSFSASCTTPKSWSAPLEFPWERWTVFLHPAQRQVVAKDYSGPFRVFGTAGTGKTIVAIHRAAFLAAANPDARVLLTTFSDTLAALLRTKLQRLLHNRPRLAERVEVDAIDTVGERLYQAQFGPPKIATRQLIQEVLAKASGAAETNDFSLRFLLSEWEDVVDAWQLDSWEAYRDVRRLGRKTRLPVAKRSRLWSGPSSNGSRPNFETWVW